MIFNILVGFLFGLVIGFGACWLIVWFYVLDPTLYEGDINDRPT